MESIYYKKIDYFLDLCKNFISKENIVLIEKEVKAILKNNKENKDITLIQNQAKIWYEELAKNNKAYFLYNTEIYLAEVWACWQVYSKKYIYNLDKAFIKENNIKTNITIKEHFEKINTILDVGNGLGLSSIYFKEIFPNAEIIGTNIQGSLQDKFMGYLNKDNIFNLKYDIPNKEIDLLFASEYFEHFEKPIETLNEILIKNNPKKLLIANSFGTKAVGHFIEYKYQNNLYSGKEISKIFNNHLRKKGYKKINTSLWNNRPSYWVLSENKNSLF